MWVDGARWVSYDEPTYVDEAALEKDARKKIDFYGRFEGYDVGIHTSVTKI
jgi:hypothetical protein